MVVGYCFSAVGWKSPSILSCMSEDGFCLHPFSWLWTGLPRGGAACKTVPPRRVREGVFFHQEKGQFAADNPDGHEGNT
ncbi:hypothetical protein CEXT_610861 [Caerostris extrusa]|uniref:Secreted protein n=1 Tax=Caerostris extrusa TaxID=172846 RepID=A0AAV4NLT4_CAEEX|nr:hypothetical protein CEXT_610861 [Caerostris extrusa]